MSIKKVTKKDGSTVYRSSVYLGVDTMTGKQVKALITAKTRKGVQSKATQKKVEFSQNGNTLKAFVKFDNFGELALSWFDGYKLGVKYNSIQSMKSFLKCYILPTFGEFRVQKITTPILQNQVNIWASNANTATIKNNHRPVGCCKNYKLLLNIMNRILHYALTLGMIRENPALNVKAPRLATTGNSKLKYFDNNNLRKFLSYLDGLPNDNLNNFDMVLYKTLIATGLRISEALALEWKDVDFDKSIIHVTKTLTRNGQMQETTKSKSGARDLSIDDKTRYMLKLFQGRQRIAFHSTDINNVKPVFASNTGAHRSRASICKRLSNHFKAAGVPNIGFHGFRHTHASILLNAGAGYKEIQQRLGHASIGMTMDTYSHLEQDKTNSTSEIFAKAVNSL